GLRGERCLERPRLRQVDEAETQSQTLEHLVEDPKGAPVDVVGADDGVAAVEKVDQRVGRREARGEGVSEPCTFQRGEAALQGSARGALRPAVFVPLVLTAPGLSGSR